MSRPTLTQSALLWLAGGMRTAKLSPLNKVMHKAGRVARHVIRQVAPDTYDNAAMAAGEWRLDRQLRRTRISLAQASEDKRPAVVFFATEADVVPHFMAHCILARTLKEQGHRVLMVGCNRVFKRCIPMDSRSLQVDAPEKDARAICQVCRTASRDMVEAYGLDVVDVSDLLTAEISAKVQQIMDNLPDDLTALEIDGIKFGQICAAETAVIFKVFEFANADPSVAMMMRRFIEAALLNYYTIRSLARSVPIRRLVYFGAYSFNLGAVVAARSLGIETTNLSMPSLRGIDRRQLVLMPEVLAISSIRNRLDRWPVWRDLALAERQIDEVADDCLYRITGGSLMVYSPARSGGTNSLCDQLDIRHDRRTLVAFTSSLDEVRANERMLTAFGQESFSAKQPFQDQIEWLEQLTRHVEASTDLQLVVRVHPREGVNRRDKVSSAHLVLLRERFSKAYRNVRFVWPAEAVSSYDLMELADVGLSAWSSTALEMARFGIPVVVAFDRHNPLPIGDVVAWSADPAGYCKCIAAALAAPPSLDLVKYAFRWSWASQMAHAMSFQDIVPGSDYYGLPPFKFPGCAKSIERVLIHGESAIDLNQEELVRAQMPSSDTIERNAILRQLRRFIWQLCVGDEPKADYRLHWSGSAGGNRGDSHASEPCDAVLNCSHGSVEFRTGGQTVRRRSRMVERLGQLAAQNQCGV